MEPGRPETPNGLKQTLDFIYRDLQDLRVDIRDIREQVSSLSKLVHEERGIRMGKSAIVGGFTGFLSGLMASILKRLWES